jgi:hypothetical protein
VAVSARGDFFASGDLDRTVRIYDRATGQRLIEYRTDGIPFRLAFGPDDRSLIAAVSREERRDVGRTAVVDSPDSKVYFWPLPPPVPPGPGGR